MRRARPLNGPNLHAFVDFFRLLKICERESGQFCRCRARGHAPLHRIPKVIFVPIAQIKAAAMASPAPIGQTASMRGGITSIIPSEFFATTPRLPRERITDSAPMHECDPLPQKVSARDQGIVQQPLGLLLVGVTMVGPASSPCSSASPSVSSNVWTFSSVASWIRSL